MKYESIKKNRDFLRAYKKGKKSVSRLIVIYKIRNEGERLIRQGIYENFDKLTDGYDYVFVARIKASEANYKDILGNLIYAVNKIQKRSR